MHADPEPRTAAFDDQARRLPEYARHDIEIALAIGVSTWIFSDLKFQADMGLLLAFTFLASLLGSIIVLPALARWMYHHHTRRDEH